MKKHLRWICVFLAAVLPISLAATGFAEGSGLATEPEKKTKTKKVEAAQEQQSPVSPDAACFMDDPFILEQVCRGNMVPGIKMQYYERELPSRNSTDDLSIVLGDGELKFNMYSTKDKDRELTCGRVSFLIDAENQFHPEEVAYYLSYSYPGSDVYVYAAVTLYYASDAKPPFVPEYVIATGNPDADQVLPESKERAEASSFSLDVKDYKDFLARFVSHSPKQVYIGSAMGQELIPLLSAEAQSFMQNGTTMLPLDTVHVQAIIDAMADANACEQMANGQVPAQLPGYTATVGKEYGRQGALGHQSVILSNDELGMKLIVRAVPKEEDTGLELVRISAARLLPDGDVVGADFYVDWERDGSFTDMAFFAGKMLDFEREIPAYSYVKGVISSDWKASLHKLLTSTATPFLGGRLNTEFFPLPGQMN